MPLNIDADLVKIDYEHCTRRCIYLWVKLQVNIARQAKRPRNFDDTLDKARPAKRSGVYDSHLLKMDDLEEILDKLKSKHKGSRYTSLMK